MTTPITFGGDRARNLAEAQAAAVKRIDGTTGGSTELVYSDINVLVTPPGAGTHTITMLHPALWAGGLRYVGTPVDAAGTVTVSYIDPAGAATAVLTKEYDYVLLYSTGAAAVLVASNIT